MSTNKAFSPRQVLSGLADEAADELDGQIRAHRELGWNALELRLIDGQNITWSLSNDDFERAAARMEESGLRTTALASAIGNWARPITGDFALDEDELRTAIPRMHRLGVKFIRTMSWTRAGTEDAAWRDEAVRRYRQLAKIAENGGVVLLHENCEGWGGQSPGHAREFIGRVAHPSVGILFDIGNTVGYGHDAWEYYQGVRSFIRHVHVKDCRRKPEGGKSDEFTYPGEGDARVADILRDLIVTGYTGSISIEPHVASIVHRGPSTTSPEERFAAYVKYGRALEKLLANIMNDVDLAFPSP